MNRSRIHPAAGTIATSIIAAFFASSVIVEIVGDEEAIAQTKTVILVALLVLVPSVAIAGSTGFLLARRRGGRVIRRKQRRMAAVGIIGIAVLVPCAIALQHLSAAGAFGGTFYLVQAIELAAGAVNVSLLALNIRDGRLLAGKISPKPVDRR